MRSTRRKEQSFKLGRYSKWNAGFVVSLSRNDLHGLMELGKDVEKEFDAKIVNRRKFGRGSREVVIERTVETERGPLCTI